MYKKILLITITLTTILFSGCATKVNVTALKPAEINAISKTKRISVVNFKNDSMNLSGKIESKLSDSLIDGKQYFTIVDRNNLENVLKEHRLQNSGMTEDNQIVEAGKITGAQAIISGYATKPSISDSYYTTERTVCNKNKECWNKRIRCTKRTGTLSSVLKITNVESGQIMYSKNYVESNSWNKCNDDRYTLPTLRNISERLAERIANDFTRRLTPSYYRMNIPFLDDADLDYTDKQEDMLEGGIDFIEAGRVDRAEELFEKLINSTNEKSYVAIYNFGVVKEVNGKLNEAKSLYIQADRLTTEPIDEINIALSRINRTIHDKINAEKQINE